MTRIVAGKWRGRRLQVPAGRTVRPTTERVREAWMAIIGPELPGARVLDLFAGSGALGLEALSRGASHATFVESHRDSLAAIRANVATLGAANQATIVPGDALAFVAGPASGEYDLALADPPFAGDSAIPLVEAWTARPFAKLLAVEHHPGKPIPGGETRRWGDVAVTFLRAP